MKDLDISGYYIPGEKITDNTTYIKGHNTHDFEDYIVSSSYGQPLIVNKLLTITPRYKITYDTPSIGDVIIGQVIEVQSKRWKLDCSHDFNVYNFYMQLSAIDLPGIMHRRKIEEDEMKMREFYDLDDLVCAEVQKIGKNGVVNVHTRNNKCKKLKNGVLVSVPAMLVKKYRSQFLNRNGVEIIIGLNGCIWVGTEKDTEIERVGMIVRYLKNCKREMEIISDEVLMNF